MKEGQLKKIRHNYIRYANCWEDADVLLSGLQVQPRNKVLSIGSAGDNSFSLLTGDPELVVAADINQVQLNLIELKKAAIKALDHKPFLQFLGFEGTTDRRSLFETVKPHLSTGMQKFWESRSGDIQAGIIHLGKFERYFGLFRTRVLPLIHSKKRIDELFSEKTTEEQAHFYRKSWNNLRWKLLFKVFFSKLVMGRVGRDPAFLKEVDVPVSDFIFNRAAQHLSSVNCQRNYFLHYILKGSFGDYLPHYARKENFEKIKANIGRLAVFQGLVEDAFHRYGKFDRFNLSDIFEYMPPGLFEETAAKLVENGMPGARYGYWNLMVPRRMSAIVRNLVHDNQTAEQAMKNDKGFFYSTVNFDVKQ